MSNKQDLTDNKALEHYCKMPEWTIDEAITLSFNKNPKEFDWEENKKYTSHPFIQKYKRTRELLIRSMSANEVHCTTDRYSEDPITIRPLDFIKWARSKDITIPTELKELVIKYSDSIDFEAKYKELEDQYKVKENECRKYELEAIDLKNENTVLVTENKRLNELLNEKPLHGSERKSFLKLLGTVTAIAYGVEDFIKKRISPTEIQKDCQDHGVEIDIKTVRQHLQSSQEELKGVIYDKNNPHQYK